MPPRSRGPYLWDRPPRRNTAGKITHRGVWLIIDGPGQESTKCGLDDRVGAEKKLEQYLNRKHTAASKKGLRDPDQIFIADALAHYSKVVIPGHARPRDAVLRVARLLKFFEGTTFADMNGDLCRSFAKRRKQSGARNDLETLRAAINFYCEEGYCDRVINVVLPPKSQARERWCTRSEAARLLRAAWRFREVQKGKPTDRRTRRHVARFILVALYTGTRAGAVCAAALEPTEGKGWIDLDAGIFYRRPVGVRETKKRRPPVPLPARLLAHLRRWKRMGQKFAVEWNGNGVKDCDKAFRNVARAAGLTDVSPHILRHTAATWLMQLKAPKWETAEYLGMSAEQLDRTYGHHHPDHLKGPRDAFDRAPKDRQRNTGTNRDHERSNVRKIADNSRR